MFLAEEAEDLGLVNEVVAPEHLLDRTLEYAAELAANASPTSMAVMKRQVWTGTAPSIAGHEDADELMKASLRRPTSRRAWPASCRSAPPTSSRCRTRAKGSTRPEATRGRLG